MRVYVATKNLGKLRELKAIFAGSELELDTFPLYAEAPENEDNYAGNAQSKARSLYAQLRDAGVRGAVLADDSGIEVAALGGRPGVLSARYGGTAIGWPERREKLLGEMASVPDAERSAKFCCAMILLLEGGEALGGYGEVEGTLTREERGRFGFGYDPVFYYPRRGLTFAQMPEDEKNRISHRAIAAQGLLTALRQLGNAI